MIYNPFLLEEKQDGAAYVQPELESSPHYVIGELKFCSDPWPPYAGKSSDIKPGYIIDILEAIYEPLGYIIKFENIPWSRCIRDARDGIFNGVAGADLEQVPDFVFPTQTVGTSHPQFYTRADSPWSYRGLGSLEDVRLGIIQDYTYSPQLDIYIRQHQSDQHLTIVKGNDGLKQLISLLQAKRIDVFVENSRVVNFTLSQMGISHEKIKSAGAPGKGDVLYVPFSPKYQESRELVNIFDRGIVQLRERGELKQILLRYQMSDWLEEATKIQKRNIGLED